MGTRCIGDKNCEIGSGYNSLHEILGACLFKVAEGILGGLMSLHKFECSQSM